MIMEVSDPVALLDQSWFPWLAAAACILLAVVQTARLRWTRALPSRRARVHAARGAAGERAAEDLLRERGYRIERRQVCAEIELLVDGAPARFGVRADLWVTRGRRRFVAEVKSGDVVSDLRHGPTRRQLLEYQLAFAEADGVLLVDASSGRVREVRFPASTAGGRGVLVVALAVAVAVVALGWLGATR